MVPLSYNLRSLAVRKTTTLATALGIALVVFVLASVLMLSNGIRGTLERAGSEDVAIVLRKGSDTEMSSGIEDANVGVVASAKEVKRRGDGQPDAVGEVVVVVALDKKGTEGVSNVTVRGVPDDVFAFRPEARIVAGRAARPGGAEVVIGKGVRGNFKGVELGQSFELRKNRPVQVVGVFEANGSSYESEAWGDLNAVRTAFGREEMVSSIRVRLESPAKLDAFAVGVEQNKQLGLEVMREAEYLEKQSEGTAIFIQAMGTVIAVLFSIGAMIGAMITMYAAVAHRRREIGTLRALGFSRASILFSFIVESVLLALGGGLVGAGASLLMTFARFSTMNFTSWSEISFSFDATPGIIGGSLAFAAAMGLLGGLLPAVRAARMPPVQAMRA
ncbi:MAG: ABC transporter permease [Myxococcota bacterium]